MICSNIKQISQQLCPIIYGDVRGAWLFPSAEGLTEDQVKVEATVLGLLQNALTTRLYPVLPKKANNITMEVNEAIMSESNVSNPTKIAGARPRYIFKVEAISDKTANDLKLLDNLDMYALILTSDKYVGGRESSDGTMAVPAPCKVMVSDLMMGAGEDSINYVEVTIQFTEDANFTKFLNAKEADYDITGLYGFPQVKTEFVSATSGASGTVTLNITDRINPLNVFASGTFVTATDWQFKKADGTVVTPTSVTQTAMQLEFGFTTLDTGTYTVYRKDVADLTDLVLLYETDAESITVS